MIKVLTKKLDQFADKDEAFDLLPYLKHYTMDLSAGKLRHFV